MDADFYGDYYDDFSDEIPGEFPGDFLEEFPDGFPEELMDEEVLRQYLDEEQIQQFQEYAQQYHNYHNYEAETFDRLPLGDLLDQCVKPNVTQAVSMIVSLLGLCLIHRLTLAFNRTGEF